MAGDAVKADPIGTAPRLYIEVLNDMFDTHTSRAASLSNRVPTPVMLLLLVGSALALGALALFLTLLGKGVTTSLITAAVLLIILFVSFDLDRPRRGFIKVPDRPLVQVRGRQNQMGTKHRTPARHERPFHGEGSEAHHHAAGVRRTHPVA